MEEEELIELYVIICLIGRTLASSMTTDGQDA